MPNKNTYQMGELAAMLTRYQNCTDEKVRPVLKLKLGTLLVELWEEKKITIVFE